MPVHHCPATARLRLVERGDPARERLERHIHDSYARTYGADLRHFLPTLIGLESADQRVLGAMGLRRAAAERLFLEQYLDTPVERVLAERLGHPVGRRDVVELGNLAAGSPGAARTLIVALAGYLRGAGVHWVVLTAVPSVRNAFRRMNLFLIDLAAADGARLGAERASWGSYYDHHPTVVACNVEHSDRRLQRALATEQPLALFRGLWQDALVQGAARAGACR